MRGPRTRSRTQCVSIRVGPLESTAMCAGSRTQAITRQYGSSLQARLEPGLDFLVGIEKAAHGHGDKDLQDLLDFLVTQEQLSVTFLSAAIERHHPA